MTNGTTLRLKGYSHDQVEGLKLGLDAAGNLIVKGAKGGL